MCWPIWSWTPTRSNSPSSFTKLKERGEEGLPLLQDEMKKPLPDANEEAKEALAKRQANAAVALVKMNHAAEVWPLLKHSPDPGPEAGSIHSLGPLGTDVAAIVTRLDEETDVSSQRALILCLGEFDAAQFPAAQRQALIAKLLDLYRNDPDPGMHGSGMAVTPMGPGSENRRDRPQNPQRRSSTPCGFEITPY